MTEHDDAYLGGITTRCDWFVQKLTEIQTAMLDPVGFQRAYEGVSDLLREVRHQGETGASILAAGQSKEDDYQDWTDEDPYSNYVAGSIKEEPPTIDRNVRDDVQTLVNEVCRQVMGDSAHVSWRGPTPLLPADRSIVWEFCSQMFHWMKPRFKAESPVVSVFCNFEGDRQVLVLEDTSSRAPDDERAGLFHYSSRFPSHTLFFLYQRVKRLGGYVEDKTDEKEGDQGHRFQLCLPVSAASVA